MAEAPSFQPPKDTAPNSSQAASSPLTAAGLSAAFARLTGSPCPPFVSAAKSWESDAPGAVAPDDTVLPLATEPKRIVEAMLFVGDPARGSVSPQRIAELLRDVDVDEVLEFVRDLNEEYSRESRPYYIEGDGTGYRVVLRDEYQTLRHKYEGEAGEARLSQAAIDVLAAIVYQPGITSRGIAQLRGRPSGGVLNQLLRRELIRLERPPDKPRDARYFPTERLLEVLGLRDWDDLPRGMDWDW